ncbi:MAG: DUF4384 domain-containing protein [Candidatus Cloacimonetes bacterium]|nr:DUF4384 domain-containing protein [Candidatus Cloacimonadota bacterium]
MKRIFFAILCSGILALNAAPSWFGDQPPSSALIYGRGSAKVIKKEEAAAMEEAKQQALTDVSHQIIVHVNARSANYEEEGLENISLFTKEVQVESCVQLCGYDVVNRSIQKDTYYILISVSRERLISHYLNMINEGVEDALSIYDGAMQLYKSDPRQAELFLNQLRAKLIDIQDFGKIFNSLYSGGIQSKVPRIRQLPRLGEVDTQISLLKGNPKQSYDDLFEDLVRQFRPELNHPHTFDISYPEWQNTGFSSDFSLNFGEYIAHQLESRFGWQRAGYSSKPEIILSGQMFQEADRINMFLKTVGTINQTYSIQLSAATVQHFGIDTIKPANLEQNIAVQQQFINETVQKGGLKVSAMFPRFSNSTAIYRLGEEASLFIRANKPCYLTIINVEADGRWNVLEQNMYIEEEDTNEWMPLYSDFTVTEPTGVEQILVQASLEKLPFYETVMEVVTGGGRKYICPGKGEDLLQTRGLVKQDPKTNEYTEYYLTWTVVQK